MLDRRVSAFLVLSCLIAIGCDRREQATVSNAPSSAPTSQPEVQWVDPSKIQPGPIQRDSLSPKQMERVRKLQAVFVEVDGQSVEQWVDGFKRDLNPDRELDIWETMAKAYTAYCSKRTLSPEAKKEVFKVVLLRSTAPEKDVLERLELKVLTKDEAVAVMRGF
jgi:hypothetical protein